MQPVLESPRLSLRPYALADAPEVQRLAGDARVAETTTAIPHPYPDGAAACWIAGHAAAFANGEEVIYAIALRRTGELVGTVSLFDVSHADARAELGYWVAVEHWGQGYCTEAVRVLMRFAQEHLKATRIVARCMARNPASARVMEKAGLRREGLLPKHVCRNGVFEDMLLYGLVLPGRGDEVELHAPARTA